MAADGSTVLPTQWFGARELAGLPGVPATHSGILRMAVRSGWTSRPRVGRGGGAEYALASLPAATQAALLLRNRPPQAAEPTAQPAHRSADQIASAWRRYDAVKSPLKHEAQRRLSALHAVQKLVSGGLPLMQARALVADQLQRDGVRGVSAVSIARWQGAVDGAAPCDWLALLVPHYAGRTAMVEIEPEAWELFKADYLRLEKPSATSCYDRLSRIAAARGWSLPSIKTFTRRIERELPRVVRVLARDGEDALMRAYPAQERDRTMLEALADMRAPWSYADAIAKRMFGIERVTWVRKEEHLAAIVAALHVEQEKRGLNAAIDAALKTLAWEPEQVVALLGPLRPNWRRHRPSLRLVLEVLQSHRPAEAQCS